MAARVLIDLNTAGHNAFSVVLETAEDSLPPGLVTDLARVLDQYHAEDTPPATAALVARRSSYNPKAEVSPGRLAEVVYDEGRG